MSVEPLERTDTQFEDEDESGLVVWHSEGEMEMGADSYNGVVSVVCDKTGFGEHECRINHKYGGGATVPKVGEFYVDKGAGDAVEQYSNAMGETIVSWEDDRVGGRSPNVECDVFRPPGHDAARLRCSLKD